MLESRENAMVERGTEKAPVSGGEATTAIYCRVSSLSQRVESQQEDLQAYSRLRGWGESLVYAETVSGVMDGTKRPAFAKLLEDCKAGKVKRVLIFDLSRLSRKGVADTIQTISWLQERGIELVSKREGLNFDGQMGLVLASLYSALAAIDLQMRREKCLLGVERVRRLNGGKCPWGGARRTRETQNDAAILRLRKNNLSIREIARSLNLSSTTVQKALKVNRSGKVA